jgi:hypothetical protein
LEPEVKIFPVNIGSATNPEYHAQIIEELALCDLIVDATANPDVFNLLAGLASDNKRPLAWAEVFGGGLGGFVGSAHPKRGPCPRCVRQGFNDVASTWPPAPNPRLTVPYGSGEPQALIATDADVCLIAAALTRRVNDLVESDEAILPSVIVIGLRRGWIFETAAQIVPITIRVDDWSCDRCWRPADESKPDIAEKAEKLFTNNTNAHNPTNTRSS